MEQANEYQMLEWIQDSTLFVGIDASQISFQMYENGRSLGYDDVCMMINSVLTI